MRSPRALPDRCLSIQTGELILVRTLSRLQNGAVEKGRQRRSRGFVVLTYFMYAAGANSPAALLDSLFQKPH
ncbi:MAG: hypothetical protein IH978_09685 [Nitrospinae bacterium]|nr:hypothetical protein [Nitrospinota bacterium]